jgi:hypothetical protein
MLRESGGAAAASSSTSTGANWPFAISQPLTISSSGTLPCSGHQRACPIELPARLRVEQLQLLLLASPRRGEPDRQHEVAQLERTVPGRAGEIGHKRTVASWTDGKRAVGGVIAETLRLQQQLVDAAGDWKRARVGLAIATTEPAFSQDVLPLIALHDRAIDRLAAAVDELEARDTCRSRAA